MVTVEYDPSFQRIIKKIKDAMLKEKVKKQISKIVRNPKIGKPMMFSRIGTREVYVAPFRLSYMFIKSQNRIIFLELYHKDEQ